MGAARRSRVRRVRPLPVAALVPSSPGRARRLAYAVLSVPLGAVYLALFAGLVAAAVTAVVLAGFGLLLVVLALSRAFGGLERRMVRGLLQVEVPDGVRLRRQPGLVPRIRGLLASGSTWRTVAWLGARVLLGTGVLATLVLGVGCGVVLLGYPDNLGVPRTPGGDLVALALVVPLAALVWRVVDLEVRVLAAVAPTLLGVSPAERMEALRQTSLRLAERNSVARDLHDTIGHTLTASLLQASAARRTLTPDPDEPRVPVDPAFARQALAHIENNTRTALAELDRALAVLGDPRGKAKPPLPELPTPDLRDVGELVAGLRDGGLPVRAVLDVRAPEVPVAASQLAYRIIQEGTTNVLRHAGCAPTTIEVRRQRDQLVVAVRNAVAARGGAGPGPGGGRGIQGLQKRVTAAGGRLTAGPGTAGGFELQAVLPLRQFRA